MWAHRIGVPEAEFALFASAWFQSLDETARITPVSATLTLLVPTTLP